MISVNIISINSFHETGLFLYPLNSPNRGKYVPEKSPYLDTFHAVTVTEWVNLFFPVFLSIRGFGMTTPITTFWKKITRYIDLNKSSALKRLEFKSHLFSKNHFFPVRLSGLFFLGFYRIYQIFSKVFYFLTYIFKLGSNATSYCYSYYQNSSFDQLYNLVFKIPRTDIFKSNFCMSTQNTLFQELFHTFLRRLEFVLSKIWSL